MKMNIAKRSCGRLMRWEQSLNFREKCSQILRISKPSTTCHSPRLSILWTTYGNLMVFTIVWIVDFVPMVKFGRNENLFDVLMQYEISRFCRLGLNRLNYYRIEIWDIITENQISLSCRLRVSKFDQFYSYIVHITYDWGAQNAFT